MPLEGQWQRTQTPLRKLTRHERNAAVAVAAVTTIALAGILLFTAGDSRPGPAPGCIRTPIAGRTGGELVKACGEEAVAVCRHASQLKGPYAEAVIEDCVTRGIKY
jgi:hypothetical protein